MKHLVEFELEEGGSITVEVGDTGAAKGITPASRGGRDKVRPAAASIIKKLRALHDPPDEVEVEFGLKMSAEAGAVVASGGVEANYKVTLTWKKE